MHQKNDMIQYEASHLKRTRISAVMIFILIPMTIAAGCVLSDGRRFMIISLAILIYTMIPFFMVFERRRPKAREIVLIAMMSAITVGAQLFFHVVLPLQIGTALVIVSGISLGPEAGFLIGAISRFICNFYMGQGPWTPWEMFCWGLLGFLTGLCFNRGSAEKMNDRKFRMLAGPIICIAAFEILAYVSYLIWPGEDQSMLGWRIYAFGAAGLIVGALLQRKRLSCDGLTLTLFTFFATFILYGGIMNICAMVTSAGTAGTEGMSVNTLRTLFAAGVPYDALHAGTAALCVFIFGDAMIRKLERIKIKYGIYR